MFCHVSLGLFKIQEFGRFIGISLEFGSSCCNTKTINCAIIEISNREYGKKRRMHIIAWMGSAGDVLRCIGQSAGISKKTRLWNDVLKNITPSMETTGMKKWNKEGRVKQGK